MASSEEAAWYLVGSVAVVGVNGVAVALSVVPLPTGAGVWIAIGAMMSLCDRSSLR